MADGGEDADKSITFPAARPVNYYPNIYLTKKVNQYTKVFPQEESFTAASRLFFTQPR
jgi:hypothetical protein